MPDPTAELYFGLAGTWEEQVAARDRVHWMCKRVKGDRVLDLGCGAGVACTLLAREGYRVVGVDADEGLIEEARSSLRGERKAVAERVSLRAADACELDAADELFDTILIGNLLESVVQPERVLSAARQLLGPDGLLVLTCAFGRQPETPMVRGIRLFGLLELLDPGWVVQEVDIRKGSIRLAARPRGEAGGEEQNYSVTKALLERDESEQRSLEVELYRAAARSLERLDEQRSRLDAAETRRDQARLELGSARKEESDLEAALAAGRQSLEEGRVERDALKSESAESEVAIAEAHRKLELLRDAHRTATSQNVRLDDALRTLGTYLPELERRKGELGQEVEKLRRESGSLNRQNAQLREMRVRFDAILDRAAPGPGGPSARLGRLLEAHRKLEDLYFLMMTGVRRKIGDAFIRAARPSVDTLLLPARMITLFAEGRRKVLARRPGLRAGPTSKGVGDEDAVPKQLPEPVAPSTVGEAGGGGLTWPAAEPGRRVCVYAEVNPNLIDGSSIWLASLLETLALSEEVRITVLLGQSIVRPAVLGHLLGHPRIKFVVADDLPGCELESDPKSRRKLTPGQAVDALEALDRLDEQALFIIRGPGIFEGDHILDAVIAAQEIAQRTWAYLVDPTAYDRPIRRDNLRRVFAHCRRVLCQTPEALEILRRQVEDMDGANGRLRVLPPMITSVSAEVRSLPTGRGCRLGYAGKLSPPYRILEMVAAFSRIRQRMPDAEFHVIGDKIHNAPRVEGFEQAVRQGLEGSPGVVWHGGVSRSRTIDLLGEVDIASSWRDASFDQSPELSTKVLEYAGLGIPVLLNPTSLQRALLGADYPAYVESESDFAEAFLRLASDGSRYRAVSEHVLAVASRYTFQRTAEGLIPEILSDGGA